jgi:hypothetical protein
MDEIGLLKILNLETGFILIPSFISNLARCTEVGLNPGQDSCSTFVLTLGIRIAVSPTGYENTNGGQQGHVPI